MEIRRVKVSSIRPYERNPRRNDGAVDAVAESIRQCGYCAPIVVDESMVILAGHTRHKALQTLGWQECEVCIVSGLTDAQKRKYRLLDNSTAEIAEWDFDLLSVELEGLDFGGFDFGFDMLIDERAERHERDKERTQQAVCDILNLDKAQFEGVGKYDIPALKPVYELPEIREWIGFNYVLSDKEPEGKAAHFFVDDYQFERLWRNPDKYIEKLSKYVCVATPDFSPYGDMPLAAQIWNHYRKHWVGAYMQDAGVTVIPTIRASTDPRSFGWYLEGEPSGGIVLISSMWTKTQGEKDIFRQEYGRMYKTLNPCKVYLYGPWVDDLPGQIERIPSFTEKRFQYG